MFVRTASLDDSRVTTERQTLKTNVILLHLMNISVLQMQTAEGLFSDLCGMVFKSAQGGWCRGFEGGRWIGKEPAFPSKCQTYCDHILRPLGMVLEKDDSTRCQHRLRSLGKTQGLGGKIEVRSPPVTGDIMEIGQCCKAALSLKIRIRAKNQI